jgi:hypothetical protein
MKAKLIKKTDGWYNLYDGEIGIGSTHEELQGYKLSKQNCDEIFGVVDVEKLANEAFPDESEPGWRDSFSPRERKGFKSGFNKAKEKYKYTKEDIDKAYWAGMKFVGEDKGSYEEFIQSLQQPTEIEVEIEMENKEYILTQNGEGFEDQSYRTWETVPKLDSEGCLILKKI